MIKAKSKPRKPVKIRKRWRINPRQRVKESAKRYARQKEKNKIKKELGEEL